MGLIVVLVFTGVFALIALPLVAMGLEPARKAKQVEATLAKVVAMDVSPVQESIIDLRKDPKISSIPWLNQKLAQFELTPHLRQLLQQADMKWSPGRLLVMSAAFFLAPAYLIHWRFGLALPAFGAGMLLGLAPLGWMMRKRKRRFNRFIKGLPEALDLMVSALRAGHSLLAAMGLVARECADPIGREFNVCFEEQNYGLELKTALENLLERIPIQDLRIVATAILIQKESGGNLAEVLANTSHVIRERFRLKRQVMVHTAQGRMTGWVLTLLPVVLGIAIYIVNPKMMSILWTRPLGVKLIWAAAGMTVLGGLVIRQIVNMEV